MTDTILIIDDEADIRNLLADIFEDENYNVVKAAHSEQALAQIKNHHIDLIILDIWLENSDMDGIEILKHLKKDENYAHIPVLMISGHGNVEMAVNAMKIGAYDFIEKPFQIDHILLNTKRALAQKQLVEENTHLKNRQDSNDQFEDVYFGEQYPSMAMQELVQKLRDMTVSDARSLVFGAPGTGKTKIAQSMAMMSKRGGSRVIILNAYDLDESDLSRAVNQAGDGTIIIQSIEKMSKGNQNALLHILSSQNIPCRFMATSLCDLPKRVELGQFSSSLYDRLSIEVIHVPSLAQRGEDIALLCQEIMNEIVKRVEVDVTINKVLPNNVLHFIQSYQWPWNIKQLKTALEWATYSMLQTGRTTMTMDDVAFLQKKDDVDHDDGNVIPMDGGFSSMPLKQAREFFEVQYLTQHLYKFNGNIALMADNIGMERTALHRKLKVLDIHYNPSSYGEVQEL